MKGRSAPATVGLWDNRAGRCYCGPRRANLNIVTRKEASDSTPSPNTHAFCAPSMKGRCAPATVAVWDYRGHRCSCASRKVNLNIIPREGTEASRVPFDPHVYCKNQINCPSGSVGLWDQRAGRCYCGPRRANLDIDPREETEASRIPFDPHVYCANQTRCPPGSAGLWDNRTGRCYCGPRRANIALDTREEAEASRPQSDRKTPTTVYVLTHRLLPQPLTFPTGISPANWTAIQTTLALLREYIKSESDLEQVCAGTKNPQAYGFKLETFRKICNPNITVPVSQPEINKAVQMVNSANFIDTILQRNDNKFGGACSEAKSPGVIPSPLDSEWILFVLCH